MKETGLKYKANYYVLLLTAFVIPLSKSLAAPLIILFFLTSLFNHRFRSTDFKINKRYGTLLPAILYLLYVFSLFYTIDLPNGLFKAEVKLSLLIFPLCFFCSSLNFVKLIQPICKAFIEGCLIAVLLSFTKAGLLYIFTNETVHFYYSNLSLYAHASYFSMYLCFCIAILYWSVLKPSTGYLFNRPLTLSLVFIFSITVGLLASKTGIGLLVLIHFSALAYWTLQNKYYLKGGILVVFLLAFMTLFYQNSKFIQSRFSDLVKATTMDYKTASITSTTARLQAWETSAQLIAKQPIIGYGLGSVTEVLIDQYKANGYVHLAKRELNSHNQMLQTTLAIGIIGLLLLAAMLLYPVLIGFRKEIDYYALFCLVVACNFITESMLETQSGVVFYAFFNSLFFAMLIANGSKTINSAGTN